MPNLRPLLALGFLLIAGCDLGEYGTSSGRHHPDGYAAAEVHGLAFKQQAEDCRGCHADDLTGSGNASSCDTCHSATQPTAWRTDCTFCHGGVEDTTGAPPRNLDGTTEVQAGTFPPHAVHVAGGVGPAYDCVQCHVKATDVLTVGHAFDSTPKVAEVDMGGGLSGLGSWDRSSGCSNLYCHGNGRNDNGQVAASAGPMQCDSCHAGMNSGIAGWTGMSGLHSLHLQASGVTCAECHSQVTSDGTSIADPDLHVDGIREISFLASGFNYSPSGQACAGTCHGHDHASSTWGGGGGGDVHPAGFAAANVHGPEFELGRQNCKGACHGDDLRGSSGPSCDSCHQAGWRTNCTYCHGGGANQTGAPPRDLASTDTSVSQSFRAHTRHVTAGMSNAWDCGQCHVKPTDVLSPGHVLDATPGAAEITFAGGRNAGGTYNGAGTCASSYCHGNGRGNNGTVTDGSPARTCKSCHAGQTSGETGWQTMSGRHNKHMKISGTTCATCHNTVTTNGTTIANRALHVDGARSISFNFSGMTYTASTKACNGPCHGEGHNGDRW